ncbi:hypothetical protein AYK26_04940 [Euryarchaeota archaeon SM23-78]|nr:MAG: hypothetical protein AYK26_04940 [Euryarchaeota archaeon SM23-78]MBW3000915.1 hypothetical protein [Candidatus Woesearchaeota archaeon]
MRLKKIKSAIYVASAAALLAVGYISGAYNGANKTKTECLAYLRDTMHNAELADSMAKSELENAVRYNRQFNDGESEIRDAQFKHSIETAREKKILAKDALKGIYDLESQIKSIR